MLLLLACTETEDSASSIPATCLVDGDHTAGWGALSHDNDADPDYGYVFDRSSVLELTLTIAAEDYAAMNDEVAGMATGPGDGPPPGDTGAPPPQGGAPTDVVSVEPTYVPATVKVGDNTWCYVGLRYKGNSTLSQSLAAGSSKLPFRLDFDEYEDEHPEVDDQRFYGFSDLSFGNGFGDATYARDLLASIVLEDHDVPVARNRFAAVSLDSGEGPVYLGLYTVAEDPSDALSDRIWGDDDGVMYKPDGTCANLTCLDDTTFEVKMNDDDGLAGALVDALAADRTDAEAWRDGLKEVLDVDGFLRWLAVNSVIENWDAYGTMAHNYYLYAPDGSDQLAWIPWDHNLSLMESMQGSGDPLLTDITEDWPLIRYTLDDEVYAEMYRAELAEALDGAYEEASFRATAEVYRELIEPYALAELPSATFVASSEDWDTAWTELYDHVSARRAEVLAALE